MSSLYRTQESDSTKNNSNQMEHSRRCKRACNLACKYMQLDDSETATADIGGDMQYTAEKRMPATGSTPMPGKTRKCRSATKYRLKQTDVGFIATRPPSQDIGGDMQYTAEKRMPATGSTPMPGKTRKCRSATKYRLKRGMELCDAHVAQLDPADPRNGHEAVQAELGEQMSGSLRRALLLRILDQKVGGDTLELLRCCSCRSGSGSGIGAARSTCSACLVSGLHRHLRSTLEHIEP